MVPVIVPGCRGNGETVTLKVRAVLLPQELLAVTEIVPLKAPTEYVIEFEVELPDQPEGNDQM